MLRLPAQSRRAAKSGFGLVEIVVVTGIVGIFFIAMYQLLFASTTLLHDGARKVEALYLTQEGIEAVRTLRNRGWTDNMATLTDEVAYYPVLASSQWTLSTADPGPIEGLYTRTVTLYPVLRDSDDNIISTGSGTTDPHTRRVKSEVTWQTRGLSRTVTLETYLTNFLNN